ncbi:MAG: precorrin-3B C(17)-methyltransferase [Pelatocladus maniniholoensis HA4357-MV3]|jgi:cobalt-precorrin 5A hydrolase/precorrin-3B C17-methyltransferase|uniref:Precorrin-3B C(17)-methyltransferase n=1 Tax=Pelatocladus maniniholoensis HA4357-MV3 TaxID=1117104 RepID=A0A9E3LSB4_9NOST|nr:precorrin-3B C(17)-methyltransferase [Pelatocladus maniniholoensis HA4357-MV3]
MTKIAPVIIVLGNNSIPVARKIISVLPEAQLYGLAGRTSDVDVSFTEFGVTLRELFTNNTPIIGFCATGILIRTLAPLLANKRQEPPVLAVAEDGSAVVPLLGGLNGVNSLARKIASVLSIKPALTTTGDIRFGIALEDPPAGYRLSNPEYAKTFMSDLLAGQSVRLEGNAAWLRNSSLPIVQDAEKVIEVTEKAVDSTPNHLIYHPATIAIGITPLNPTLHTGEDCELVALVQQMLADAQLAPASVAGVFASISDAAEPGLQAIASSFNLPIRFFTPDAIAQVMYQNNTADVAIGAALLAAAGELVMQRQTANFSCAIAIAPLPIDINTTGTPRGRLAIIGTGPGRSDWMSPEVKEILRNATDFVGYSTYLNLVKAFTKDKRLHESDNREEIARAKVALDLAAEGWFVVVISSGDPGIYAMAAAVFEVLDKQAKPEWQSIEIQVAPGISAMQAAAAKIGAPLGHDFCTISLSDILKPWSIIEQRITAAAQADFVIAFYNPVSKQRTWQLAQTQKILLRHRSADTPVVLARNLGRDGESTVVCTLGNLVPEQADMRTVIIVGSSKTRMIQKPDGGIWVYTPRRYDD